ncbi:hypothetical protein LTS18_002222 [Coniosporium uncinatum]|uniref:Uncharacterized protein n=1 Tax=Coniosporium uncinatum TaxID=93489 RepID=A0ACC3DEC7_9PEZI|nr:hypothetical protein LTS18_002222 [Coniosporium uncinatum]
MFCHVINTLNTEDLQRIDYFVSSLQATAQTSESAEKLYRLCQVFHQVAKLYVEAKQQAHVRQQSQLGTDFQDVGSAMWDQFDPYLTALGFAPTDISTNAGNSVPQINMPDVGDWYSGNHYVMNMLDTDLSFLQSL